MVANINKMHIAKKRGRPRKRQMSMLVKAFQLPGKPWKPISRKNFVRREVAEIDRKLKARSEAEKVLETGKLLGLGTVCSEGDVLQNIVQHI